MRRPTGAGHPLRRLHWTGAAPPSVLLPPSTTARSTLIRRRRADDSMHARLNDDTQRRALLRSMLGKWLDRENPLVRLAGLDHPTRTRVMPHRGRRTIIDLDAVAREIRCHACDTPLDVIVAPYSAWLRERTHCPNPTCWALNRASAFRTTPGRFSHTSPLTLLSEWDASNSVVSSV